MYRFGRVIEKYSIKKATQTFKFVGDSQSLRVMSLAAFPAMFSYGILILGIAIVPN
jgi:hypothetical protein